MPKDAYIAILQKLIARELEAPPLHRFDGYISDPDSLTRLSAREAQTAIDFGIPIGVYTLHAIYHGSRKGEYIYNLVDSVVRLRRLLSDQSTADFATIVPNLQRPDKLLHYIREIHEFEDNVMAMERFASREEVASIKSEYPPGCRVELIRMPDPQTNLKPGDQGTVTIVDDIGTIHVRWDNGSSLGVAYRADKVKRI